MSLALRLAGVALAGVLLALLLLFLIQRRLIYPAPAHPGPVTAAGFEAVTLTAADGLRLAALYRPAAPGRPTLVFFHGNGDSLRGSLIATAGFVGHGLLLPEYRGYGGNPGSPDEAGLYADGEAALAWLAARGVGPARTVLIGNSLGSGVATELAARHRVAGLVIVSGFTSLPAAAAGAFGLPIGALVRDRFDNAAKLPRVTAPVLVLHGDADRVIAVAHGRALGARVGYREFPGVGHELAYRPEAQAAITAWLSGIRAE